MNSFPQRFRFHFASALLMILAGALPLAGSRDADAADNAALEEPSPVEPEPILPRNGETPHISGGTSVAPPTPWVYRGMAGIIKGDTPKVVCGAAILANYHVITSASCVFGLKSEKLSVLVGDIDTANAKDSPYAAVYPAQSYTVHPSYNSKTLQNDIAVVRTQRSIVFSTGVGNIFMPPNNLLFANSEGKILGWGTTSSGGAQSTVLQVLSTKVMSNAECAKSRGSIFAEQLCTTSPTGSACQYDAGGPLLVMLNGRPNLAGIMSTVKGCGASTIDVHTRVTSYIPWLQQVTNNALYF